MEEKLDNPYSLSPHRLLGLTLYLAGGLCFLFAAAMIAHAIGFSLPWIGRGVKGEDAGILYIRCSAETWEGAAIAVIFALALVTFGYLLRPEGKRPPDPAKVCRRVSTDEESLP